jgi:hypothetical protein
VKYRILFLVVCALFLNCPRSHKPKVDRIEVTYLSSLYDDVKSGRPLLAGIQNIEGITLGHTITQPPYVAHLLSKFGFFDLLNETGIDYVIVDPRIVQFDNINYFVLPHELGYVISNYEGIRFAILSKGKDSLTIQDQISVEIVNQRSDIMWIIDPAFLPSPAMTYYFYVKNRALADTSTATFEATIDTLLARRLQDCVRRVQDILDRSITLNTPSVKEFTLNTLMKNEGVDAILYPSGLFISEPGVTTLTFQDFMSSVACEQRLGRKRLSRTQIEKIQAEENLIVYGNINDTNVVLYPNATGQTVFDLLSLIAIPTKY